MQAWWAADAFAGILPAMGLRTVVVEDDLLVREGIVRLLCAAPDLDVVAACGDFDEGVAAIESSDEGIRLARRLRTSHPRSGVVVSQYSGPDQVLGQFEAGADRRPYVLAETHTSPVA